MKAKFLIIILAILITSAALEAQNKKGAIKGIVTDKKTNEALVSATVFLENTTFGTMSENDGRYIIPNISPGSYYLIVSSIGYEIERVPVTVAAAETLDYKIRLKEKSITIGEVNVIGKSNDEWKEHLEVFTEQFIGETQNSHYAKILNPEVINFTKDPETKQLNASTDSVIVVENKALGYRLYIMLASFTYSQKQGVNYLTHIRFQELRPEDKDQEELWKTRREETYTGSQKHFFNSLLNKKLHQEGFRLSQGPMYLLTSGLGVYVLEEDVDIEEDLNDLLRMDLETSYRIDCQKNSTVDYIVPVSRFILLDKDGNRMDGGVMNVGGYWASQRIADALPYNYDGK